MPVLLASSGTAVADVLVDVGLVIKVIVLEEDEVEFNRLDDITEEPNCEEEEGGTLAMG